MTRIGSPEWREECADMAGDDRLPLWRDPLYALRDERNSFRRSGGDRWAKLGYQHARLRAMRPVSGLAQADMLANATRCVAATQDAVQTMRAAA